MAYPEAIGSNPEKGVKADDEEVEEVDDEVDEADDGPSIFRGVEPLPSPLSEEVDADADAAGGGEEWWLTCVEEDAFPDDEEAVAAVTVSEGARAGFTIVDVAEGNAVEAAPNPAPGTTEDKGYGPAPATGNRREKSTAATAEWKAPAMNRQSADGNPGKGGHVRGSKNLPSGCPKAEAKALSCCCCPGNGQQGVIMFVLLRGSRGPSTVTLIALVYVAT